MYIQHGPGLFEDLPPSEHRIICISGSASLQTAHIRAYTHNRVGPCLVEEDSPGFNDPPVALNPEWWHP